MGHGESKDIGICLEINPLSEGNNKHVFANISDFIVIKVTSLCKFHNNFLFIFLQYINKQLVQDSGCFQLRQELKWGAILFFVLGFVKPCYYIYKVVKVSTV